MSASRRVAGMPSAVQRERMPREITFVAGVAGVAVTAGVILLCWQLSPAGRLLGHGSDRVNGINGISPGGAAMVVWFTLSWLLMTLATMLPTSIPLLSAFRRMLAGRVDVRRLLTVVVCAYLGVWLAAGLVLAALDVALHAVTERSMLRFHTPLVVASTLLVAGAHQLSARSARCLRACRSPFSFLARRWTGSGHPTSQATLVGIDYGLSCLGCCAALMLVMFAIGMASPLAMIGLGGVAALHKHAAWGATLAKATGATMVASAVLISALHIAQVR